MTILRPLCLAAGALLLGSFPAMGQRIATGEPVVILGFVVDIIVTDPGAGYMSPPTITIIGGGGTGGVAVATMTNDAVSHVTVLDAGYGYTNMPMVEFSGPQKPAPLSVRMVPLVKIEGASYSGSMILQWADALGDTNQWFTITNVMVGSNAFYFSDMEAGAASKRFYRALVIPQPANPDPSQLVWVPSGTFLLGSPGTEQDRSPSEGPQTAVRISRGFFMRKYEVTQGEYSVVVGSNPSYHVGDAKLPVEQVSWNDATNFCAQLTTSEQVAGRLPLGWVYRLPTEAEWEHACRGGTTTRFSFGDDPAYGLVGQYAWYFLDCLSTQPVGGRLLNPWGLYDMHGNVREWCLDWLGTYPGTSQTDPQGEASEPAHAIRGGSWQSAADGTRSAYRDYAPADYIYNNIGFRPVLAPLP